jgi:hypothetical protein
MRFVLATCRVAPALLLSATALAAPAAGGVVPTPIADVIHGRVMGWAPTGHDWFVVYVDRAGDDWCGLRGATWRMALVSRRVYSRVIFDRKVTGAMCGNALAWVRAGRFSDGKHREVAFMLWATSSLGATTYIYRVRRKRLFRLASFRGDRVTLGRATVTVSFENRGRSPHGELQQVWKFAAGRYRLTARR